MAIDVSEYRGENSSWYTFPDGTKVQGKTEAESYAKELADLDAVVEEEQALDEEAREREAEAADEHDGEGVVTSEDLKADEPLVAGDPTAEPKPVVDAADGDEGAPVDNKNTPYSENSYLIEMTRQNRMFEYAGEKKNYVFRHDARILVVDGQDVQGLVDGEGGFRIVTPGQAKEYYS